MPVTTCAKPAANSLAARSASSSELPAVPTSTSILPVVISDVNSWCGCTTAEYTKTPILPGKTAKEIISLVRSSADRYLTPDNIYGYGIPDFWRAYQQGR